MGSAEASCPLRLMQFRRSLSPSSHPASIPSRWEGTLAAIGTRPMACALHSRPGRSSVGTPGAAKNQRPGSWSPFPSWNSQKYSGNPSPGRRIRTTERRTHRTSTACSRRETGRRGRRCPPADRRRLLPRWRSWSSADQGPESARKCRTHRGCRLRRNP